MTSTLLNGTFIPITIVIVNCMLCCLFQSLMLILILICLIIAIWYLRKTFKAIKDLKTQTKPTDKQIV